MEAAVAVNWLAVIVAAVVRFAIGAGWYTALFGARWRQLMGVPANAQPSGMGQAMLAGFIGDLVMAYILARFIGHYGATGLFDGVIVGFLAWLGFVATIMLGSMFYEKKPGELVAINGGYQLITIVIMGAILTVWR